MSLSFHIFYTDNNRVYCFACEGGVFTVSGLVDKLIYNSAKILQQKTDLGKAG